MTTNEVEEVKSDEENKAIKEIKIACKELKISVEDAVDYYELFELSEWIDEEIFRIIEKYRKGHELCKLAKKIVLLRLSVEQKELKIKEKGLRDTLLTSLDEIEKFLIDEFKSCQN